MSWLIPQASGSGWVNTTGRLANPRTAAQQRAAAATSGNKTTVVYGVVTTAIPSATLVDPQIVIPSTTGVVQLNANAGDSVPVVGTPVTNPLLIGFAVYDSVVLEKRDDKYVVIGGTKRDGATLLVVSSVTSESGASRNTLISCDATGGSFSVFAPYNGDDLAVDDLRVGEEFGVLLAATGSGNKVTIEGDALAAGGSGQVDFTWKNGQVASTIVLTTTGDFVRLMYLGFTAGGGGVDHWLVVSDERAHGHLSSFTAVKTGAYTAVPGDMVRCDTSGGSFAVSLPADCPIDTEISVRLGTAGTTTKLTVTATGTGASIAAGLLPVISSVSVELFLIGDTIKLKHLGTNDWVIVYSSITPHVCELESSSSAAQSFNSGTITVVDMTTAVIDNASLGNVTNNDVTIRRAGKYNVSTIFCVRNTSQRLIQINSFVFLAGVSHRNTSLLVPDNGSVANATIGANWVLDLAAGAVLDARGRQISGDAGALSGQIGVADRARLMVQEVI